MACRYNSFSAREISEIARRCACAGIDAESLMHQIIKHIDDYVDVFSLEDLEQFDLSIMWQATANTIARRGYRMRSPLTMISTIEAYTAHDVTNPDFYDTIANAAKNEIDSFTSEDLVAVIQCLAKAGIQHKALFEAVAIVAVDRINEFELPALISLSWSYSAACVVAPALLEAINAAAGNLSTV